MDSNDDNIKYFQPSFFDLYPEIFNEDTCKLIEPESDEAAEPPMELLSNDYDNSDNGDAINMEFLDADFRIHNDDEIESLEEFSFFDWAGKGEVIEKNPVKFECDIKLFSIN